MEIVLPATIDDDLRQHLFASTDEACAVLRLNPAMRGGRARHLVHTAVLPTEADYISRSAASVALHASFYVPIVTRAANEQASIAFVHSHPFAHHALGFSSIDDAGERSLARYLQLRVPNLRAFAIVCGPARRIARQLASGNTVPISSIGSTLERPQSENEASEAVFDRQVRAFGEDGQRRIQGLRIGIVGVGGTGSLVAQELAFLGVRDFVLIDPDCLEVSNANRVVGATASTIGRPKVDVAAETVAAIRPTARVERLQASVLQRDATERVLACDFLFSCTDSHGSRALLNQIAYQYLIPCIDMGVAIGANAGTIVSITGRVQMLAPGLPCLACGALLDPEAIRLDFLPEEQRKNEPYFVGGGVTQPAVISINGVVASLAVTMFLGAVAGVTSPARLLFYDGIKGSVRPTSCNVVPDCIVCSPTRGALAQGDLWPLPSSPVSTGDKS